jgi:hypothetical protein
MVFAAVKALAERPRSDQGETEAKPRPAPRVTRTIERDTATTAPARMAPQEAAGFALRRAASSRGWDAGVVPITMSLQPCEHMASNRMIGRGTPNIHSNIPRPITKSPLEFLNEKLIERAEAWSDCRTASRATHREAVSATADKASYQPKACCGWRCRNRAFRSCDDDLGSAREQRPVLRMKQVNA